MTIRCPKCNGISWVIKEEICIGQDGISVECECNTLGCGERKNIFIDISKGIENLD